MLANGSESHKLIGDFIDHKPIRRVLLSSHPGDSAPRECSRSFLNSALYFATVSCNFSTCLSRSFSFLFHLALSVASKNNADQLSIWTALSHVRAQPAFCTPLSWCRKSNAWRWSAEPSTTPAVTPAVASTSDGVDTAECWFRDVAGQVTRLFVDALFRVRTRFAALPVCRFAVASGCEFAG